MQLFSNCAACGESQSGVDESSDILGTLRYSDSIIIIIIIITAIEFSHGSSSPYTSTNKTNNIHKRNNTIYNII